MGDTLVWVNDWLDYFFTFGPFWVYAVILLACFVENLFPPFPGDSFIVVTGGLIAFDRLDAIIALLVVNAGGLLSVMMLYFFGGKYGRNYFLQKDFKYFSAADIVAIEGKLARWGGGILVFSRFVVGFRSALAVVAGIGKYPASKMFLFSAISYFAFTSLLMYIGFSLVENFDSIESYFDKYNKIVWPLLGILVAIWIGRRIQKLRKG